MKVLNKMYETMESIEDNIYNVEIKDPTTFNWNSFPWDEGWYAHKISQHEILKPYLIAYTYYGDVRYEHVLLELNKINDIWEVVPGTEIRVPKLREIKRFITENKQ